MDIPGDRAALQLDQLLALVFRRPGVLFSFVVAEIVNYAMRIYYYRRGF
jgi:hypothetical protein